MGVPPGNEGSDGPQLTSPLPPVAPAGERTGRRSCRGGTGPPARRGVAGLERLRAFDRRYATFVDIALAAALFVLCSGWFTEAGGRNPNLWFVAALTFPLVFRRRAPMTVFLAIAAVAFVQWLVTGPALADASLLVNTTTLGMHGQPALAVDLARLPGHAVVADLVYAPVLTPLLAAAKARDLRTTDGLGMLLHQAVRGFALWFGKNPEVTAELRTLVEADLAASGEKRAG